MTKKNLNPRRKRMWLFSLHSFLKTRIHWGLAAFFLQEPFIPVLLRITAASAHFEMRNKVFRCTWIATHSQLNPLSIQDHTGTKWPRLLEILVDGFSQTIILSDPRVTIITRFLHGKSFLRAQLELYWFWPASIPLADQGLWILSPGVRIAAPPRPPTPKKKHTKNKTHYSSDKAFSV